MTTREELRAAAMRVRELEAVTVFDLKTWDRVHRITCWAKAYADEHQPYEQRYVQAAAEELRELYQPPASDQYSAAQVRVIRRALHLADLVTGES